MARWSSLEKSLREQGVRHIAGVDEVGRGPLAGPVVACAIVMPADARAIAGVADSKTLDAPERVRLAALIRARAVAYSLGAASVREIAELNILQATSLAMRRALARVDRALQSRGAELGAVVIDGRPMATLGREHTAVVKGDAKVYAIACASIVAKVARDRLMETLGRRHPGYGWERNAGYGTPLHIEGLRRLGLTAHHRELFCRGALSGRGGVAPDPG
jgi:ribonuclease HII